MIKDTAKLSQIENIEPQDVETTAMDVNEGKIQRKRKRISFAETVQSVENSSAAIQEQKRRKSKSKNVKEDNTLDADKTDISINETPATPASIEVDLIKTENQETPAEKNIDLWAKIVEDSKSSGMNYEDAIKTILLEKLLAVVNNSSDEIIYADYVKFITDLSLIFEKLRRFPKMISKFLYCVRTDIVPLFETIDKQNVKHVPWTDLVLPSKFMDSIAPVVSLLPSGQIIDLWKTIHHNLDEECVKKIVDESDQPALRHFFTIVVAILTEFMSSIKVSDTSVPISQIEKIVDIMTKLKDDCLVKLGIALLKRKHNTQLMGSFLKLSYTWAELHALLMLYNVKYKAKNEIITIASSRSSDNLSEVTAKLAESTSAFNLTTLHPYLDTQSWISLGNIITKSEDASSNLLLAKLVAQKMKYLRTLKSKITIRGKSTATAVEGDGSESGSLSTQLKAHLEEAAEFLWLGRWKTEWISSPELDNVFVIASECLDLSKIMQLANNFVGNFHLITQAKTKEGEGSIGTNSIATEVKEESDVEMTDTDQINKSSDSNSSINSYSLRMNDNPTFCTAVVLELSKEILRRFAKMKLETKFIKNVSKQIFLDDKKHLVTLLSGFTLVAPGDLHLKGSTVEVEASEKLLNLFLDSVNDLIEKHSRIAIDIEKVKGNIEFSPELVKDLLSFLSELPLNHYSKEIKSFLTLFAIAGLISIAPYVAAASASDCVNEIDVVKNDNSKIICGLVIQIILKCAFNSKGNPILFGIKWNLLWQWFSLNVRYFSTKVSTQVLGVILHNIYISSKCVEDFQKTLYDLCEETELTSVNSKMTVLLATFEFLIEEYASSGSEPKSNSKLTPFIESHTRKLTHLVVELLAREQEALKTNETLDGIEKNAADKDKAEASSQALVRIYRSCLLARKALKTLATTKGKPSNKTNSTSTNINSNKEGINEDFQVFKSILPTLIQSTMAFLKKFKTKAMRKLMRKCGDLSHAKDCALEFLHSVCEGTTNEFEGELPEDFMQKLWSICMKGKLLAPNQGIEIPTTASRVADLPKHIYQVSGSEEFQVIADSIIEEINSLSTSPESDVCPDEEKLSILTGLVDKLVDAELTPEKKQFRRQILDTYLHGFLISTLYWKDYSVCNYVPVLDLQLKMGRRRNTMCSVESLANCLVSITAVPLKTIEDLSVFKEVFCKAADLLNAFTMHRLDVISYRTHIHLQCFQFLVECLTLKADQKNKLTDGEILDLRYCAHSIERVCQSVKLGQKEFARVSPYFLAVLMKQMDMCTVYPAVKNPLMSGCNKLLDLCDEHAVAQLNSMLSSGSREIFKATYDLYKKFYRYAGKV